MSRRALLFCDICNPLALLVVEMRPGAPAG